MVAVKATHNNDQGENYQKHLNDIGDRLINIFSKQII